MDSSDLAMLLGLVGGGAGAYFGGQRRKERERADKKQDMLDELEMAKLLRDEEKKILEEEQFEADTKRFKREGRELEGPRRGELIDPSLWDMFGGEYDPLHELMERTVGLDAANWTLGTTDYDTSLPIDQRIRNPESENFVENRANNFISDTGLLGLGSMLIPGVGLARLGGLGAKAAFKGLGPLSKWFKGRGAGAAATPITDPSRLLPAPYNQGGIVDAYRSMNRG